MSFNQIFYYEILELTWKANQNELPNFFGKIFPHLTINDRTRNGKRDIRFTRNFVPIRTNYKSRFIGNICSSTWINLPQAFKAISSYPLFTKKIKSYCMENY